jgi:hypothetical protein
MAYYVRVGTGQRMLVVRPNSRLQTRAGGCSLPCSLPPLPPPRACYAHTHAQARADRSLFLRKVPTHSPVHPFDRLSTTVFGPQVTNERVVTVEAKATEEGGETQACINTLISGACTPAPSCKRLAAVALCRMLGATPATDVDCRPAGERRYIQAAAGIGDDDRDNVGQRQRSEEEGKAKDRHAGC